MKDFAEPIAPALLNIEDKSRSNLFAWRGQFSPQLIECLLEAYCPPGARVLDPFAGSGTVLFESANMGLPAFGVEINPSAWSFSKLYEFANLSPKAREQAIAELRERIRAEFPIVLFSDPEPGPEALEARIIRMGERLGDPAMILCNALVVLLDIVKNRVTSDRVQNKFLALAALVRGLPYSDGEIRADLQDARSLSLKNQSMDFVLTSPPYINVFNYHQNYRRSVEALGWDVLQVARSEIGSNRANRGNRFYTVVQYCIDMAGVLQEIARVLKPEGRAIVIVGYESNVLGVPFYNADIVEQLAKNLGIFDIRLRQQRVFKNRFGQLIREEILNLSRRTCVKANGSAKAIGREIAHTALKAALHKVPLKNRQLLNNAIFRAKTIDGTPLFDHGAYAEYQTRDSVMMVKERG